MKRPAFQFYPGDWLRSTDLRSCSVGARGLWIDMICLMHEGIPYGYLKAGDKVILPANLARMVGASSKAVDSWLTELRQAGVYSIDSDGCIFSRRMVKDERIRLARAAGGVLGGNPALTPKVENKDNLQANLKPTPAFAVASASAIATSKPKPSRPKLSLNGAFNDFWQAYPRKVAKGAAERAWIAAKPDPALEQLILQATERAKASDDWKRDSGKFIPHPATWLNQKRWLDETTTRPSLRQLVDMDEENPC